ncbi:hypothetical protein [Fuchsiella alkaliacetigena]|uniref:hypothetical protein n=1 Tax=Fuchsiella alkaliacetigena TaxID=957042 RepID=UPI002009E55E|nr:hypothetical protein [Fuchsiella alkaliacetigena]MCK8824711.1 hypothetical protein [Fuchsiella alkaliacetigena]
MELESCYPKGTDLDKQISKLIEELEELFLAADHKELAAEALDIRTVCDGIFELAIEEIGRNNDNYKQELTERLIQEHKEKLLSKKQLDGEGEVNNVSNIQAERQG